MIQLEGVTKQYSNGVTALKDVNLTIEQGEFVFIVGASGAGKSTLIKLLLKEERPTEGRIFFNNQDITHLSSRRVPKLRRQIGVVFQDFRLLPKKTVYENVAMAMEILGKSTREIRRQVPLVLGLVSLSARADNYPDQLSGGEHQRVAIARAIVNNPSVLIADEPTGNLDVETAAEIMHVLQNINNKGTTVIMATHAKDIVDRMQKRVISLADGSVIRDEKGGYEDL